MGPTGKPTEEVSNDDHRLQGVKNPLMIGAIPNDVLVTLTANQRLEALEADSPEMAARHRLSGCLRWIDATSGSGKFDYLNDLISNGTTLRERLQYCSEACQRAHWLAGHMHECPRADAQQGD